MHISDHFKHNFLFDSHSHINADSYNHDLDKIIHNALNNDVQIIFDMGTTLKSSQKSVKIAQEYEGKVYSFIGIDPEVFIPGSEYFLGLDKNEKWFEEQYDSLKKLITDNSGLITGIGETGMDFHYITLNKDPQGMISQRFQERLFEMHIQLAEEFNLPLSIHSRGAEHECLEMAKHTKVTGIFHSYTGNYQTAVKVLDAGWGLGVNGIVTFKNAVDLQSMYKKILGNNNHWEPQKFYKKGIFFETDCPFLAPEGKRGERNEPMNVRMVYESFINLLHS